MVTINFNYANTRSVPVSTRGVVGLENIIFPSVLPSLEEEVCRQIDEERFTLRNPRGNSCAVVQSDDIYSRLKRIYCTQNIRDKDFDYFVKLLEDVLMTCHLIMTSKSKFDYTMSVVNFVKLRMNDPLISSTILKQLKSKFDEIFGSYEVQSDDMFNDSREYIDRFKEVRRAPVFKKLYKFSMFLLCTSLFDGLGFTFESLGYRKLEEEMVRRECGNKLDFIECILDLTHFLCERGYQCIKTGSLDPIFHSGTAYEAWYESAQKIKMDSLVLTNPEPHGVNPFSFLADLSTIIEKGEAIYKHAFAMGDFEKSTVRHLLNDLKLVKCNHISKRSAQKKRTAPFSVLIYGGSGVAKSKFTELLFLYYGKLFGHPIDDEFMYTRSAADPFWSGFSSAEWCGLLDDVAFMHPNVAVSGDPTLMELIQVINDVAFVPNQADLADKGKTPVRFKFVMATTNAEHLNAYAYFSSPLALQRRLPWIIDIKPKAIYTRDGCMIDQTKLPVIEDGIFPDFWDICIKRVIPMGVGRNNQKAGFESIHNFDNIKDFLKWFAVTAQQHEITMAKSKACTSSMALVELCTTCHLPQSMCECVELQAHDIVYREVDGDLIASPLRVRNHSSFVDEEEFKIDDEDLNLEQREEILIYENAIDTLEQEKEDSFVRCWGQYMYLHIVDFFLTLFFELSIFRWGVTWLYSFPVLKRWVKRVVSTTFNDSRILSLVMKKMGGQVQRKIGNIRILNAIAGFLAASSTAYVLIKMFKSFFQSEDESVSYVSVEGNNQSKLGKKPVIDEIPRENVWMKEDNEVTTFDTSPLTRSYKGIPFDRVKQMILENCIFARIQISDNVTRPIKAVALSGHIYLFNKHAFPDEGEFKVTIIRGINSPGINANIVVTISQCDITRYPTDLCTVNIRDLPPRKDITSLFCCATLRGTLKGIYVGRNEDGSSMNKTLHAIRKVMATSKLGAMETWKGVTNEPTINGDCGAVMLANTDFGPIILGIHNLGGGEDIFSVCVTDKTVKNMVKKFEPIICSGIPSIQSTSVKRGLVELHYKSTVRYIEDGTANVYGSFTGFRARLKSRVEPTFISKIMAKHGYMIRNGKPCMDWRPWNKALDDMVKPCTSISSAILDDCVSNFTNDILRELPQSELDKIHVYDTFTAINGAAGVSYVDKINRSTSAGCPWKKSKKYFEEAIQPAHDLLDPITYNTEIMDRVNACIDTYLGCNRYMPVFCGNLKDEARPFIKIADGNTRMFAGAALDWTIVVRKYLLSIIRVVQGNRFVFESAPGTIAQSLEWESIRKYLTKFGKDRIVAGDYGKFDKKMCSKMILAAFKIIENICRSAGYSEEEIAVVRGIAEDTAFPFVDFNGDLIEFFGSNPSGHPLTVIINGLANCLYMRYAFACLSPDKSSRNFKELVNLFTYGDDNAMGVSSLSEWFNHTAIQSVMASIGVKYTMADKEAKSVPYINIDNCSFLKRSWRYDGDVGAYVCPLEHESIEKMLTIGVKSKSITEEAHAVEVISTALREYFFYGKDVFDTKRKLFKSVVHEANINMYVTESTFPTWEELRDKFWKNSMHVKLAEDLEDCSLESMEIQSYCLQHATE